MEYVLLVLVGLAFIFGTPILAIAALARTSGLREQNARLAAEVAELRRLIAERPTATGGAPAAPTAATAPGAPAEAPLPPPFEPVPGDEPVVAALPPPQAPPSGQPASPAEIVVPRPAVPRIGWEQRLGARAFVWIGAITLALAAIFLVRYSIEEGYLSPEVRVILAAVFGFALIGAAERVRLRDARVAQAMVAAGVAAVYGALFAAVELYDMISKAGGVGGAAALTAFAIGLSLRHGMFVAGLAFVGGFASPAIIQSDVPNVAVLFGYLLAIAAGTLAVIRHRGWWLLGWGVLAGSAIWVLAWATAARGSGLHWVGLFLVAVAGLFVWATWRRMEEKENPSADIVALVWSALAVTGALLVMVVVQDSGRQTTGWLALVLHGAGLYALGRWTPRFQFVAALAPALSLAALVLWWVATQAGGSHWDDERFAWAAILLGGFYAGGAFALLWNAGRPGFWAALAVAAALGHFLLCWYVLRSLAGGTPWGLISIALAVPFLVGAERLVRWRDSMPGAVEALGFLAAGVSFFIAAAIPLELRREWITVAYAIELAAVAIIANRLDLWAMRQICWALLAVVVVRFALNPYVLRYSLGVTPVLNWILWSYGVSIAALAVARRELGAVRDDPLTRAVSATILLLVFVLLSLEVHSLFQWSSFDPVGTSFTERSCLVVVWGGFALAALWLARLRLDPVLLWAWRLGGMFALALVFFVQVLLANPIVHPTDVGALPILNGLVIAYAIPAAMVAVARRWADIEKDARATTLLGTAASVLAFVYVSLEVRHFFDPQFARPGLGATGMELYAYSFFWLLFGVVVLALGFVRGSAALRHAGMALVCVVVAKVFLIDMADLQGLLRVFSFLGLGAALLGLGYAYRRFGFDRGQQA